MAVPDSDNELARVSRAFNDMAAELQESRERTVYLAQVASWQSLARKAAELAVRRKKAGQAT